MAKLVELVGKQVIRTAPALIPNGYRDCSYQRTSDYKITVMKVINGVPIVKIGYSNERIYGKPKVTTLQSYFNDDNWADVSEFYENDWRTEE